jgi:uncharacterized phage-associated protein
MERVLAAGVALVKPEGNPLFETRLHNPLVSLPLAREDRYLDSVTSRTSEAGISMPAPFPARYVLNTLLQRGFKEGRVDMTPMKAQKLLFFTHGWHLATTGLPAIDKAFEAWQYGPVVDQLYHDLKRFGSGRITDYVKDEIDDSPLVISPFYKEFYEVLDIVWEKYIGFDAITLSTMTHYQGTPWSIARAAGSSVISNDLIRDYFVGQAKGD